MELDSLSVSSSEFADSRDSSDQQTSPTKETTHGLNQQIVPLVLGPILKCMWFFGFPVPAICTHDNSVSQPDVSTSGSSVNLHSHDVIENVETGEVLFHKTSRLPDTTQEKENVLNGTDASLENEVTAWRTKGSKENLIHVLKANDTLTDELVREVQHFMETDFMGMTQKEENNKRHIITDDTVTDLELNETDKPPTGGNLKKMNKTRKDGENKLESGNEGKKLDGTRDCGSQERNVFKRNKNGTKKTLCPSCRRKEMYRKMIFVFNVVLLTCNVGRYMTIFFDVKSVDSSVVLYITTIVFFVQALFCYLASYYSLNVHLPNLLNLTQLYGHHYSVASSCSKLHRKIKGHLVFGIIFQVIVSVTLAVGFITFLPSFKRHLTPFDQLNGVALYAASSVFALVLFQSLSTINAIALLFFQASTFLNKEFTSVAEQFSLLFRSRKDFLLDDLNDEHDNKTPSQAYRSDCEKANYFSNTKNPEVIPEAISYPSFDTPSTKKTKSTIPEHRQHRWRQTEKSRTSYTRSTNSDQSPRRKQTRNSDEKKGRHVFTTPKLTKSQKRLKSKAAFVGQPTSPQLTTQARSGCCLNRHIHQQNTNKDRFDRVTHPQTGTNIQHTQIENPTDDTPSFQIIGDNVDIVLENMDETFSNIQDEHQRQETTQGDLEQHHEHLTDTVNITHKTQKGMKQTDRPSDAFNITSKNHEDHILQERKHHHTHDTETSDNTRQDRNLQKQERHLRSMAEALERIQAHQEHKDDPEDNEEDHHRDLEVVFDHLQGQHQLLCIILQHTRGCLSHLISLTFISGIPMFCIIIYGLASSAIHTDETAYLGYVSMLSLLGIFNTTIVGILIHDNAHGAQQVIYETDWTKFSDRLLSKIQLFVNRLSHSHIGYDVYGLFVIDRSSVLMVVGTLVTYTVVMLQFYQGETNGTHDLANNATLRH